MNQRQYNTFNAGNFYKHKKNHEGKNHKFNCLACDLNLQDNTKLKAHFLTQTHINNVKRNYSETLDHSKIAMKKLDLNKRTEYIKQVKGNQVDLSKITNNYSSDDSDDDLTEDEQYEIMIKTHKNTLRYIGEKINQNEFINEEQATRYIEAYNTLIENDIKITLFKQIELLNTDKIYKII
jgi:hypothetical protein